MQIRLSESGISAPPADDGPSAFGAANRFGLRFAVLAALLVTACAAQPSQPTPTSTGAADRTEAVVLDIGGAAVNFAPIDGFCIYPPKQLAQSIYAAGVTNPDLVVHIYFGDCGEIRAAEALDGWVVDDGDLATPKELVGTDLGNDRTGFVKAMAAELRRTDFNKALGAAQGQVSQVLSSRGVDLRFGEATNLGVVDQDRDAVYFAVIQKGEANSSARSASLSRLTVGAATLLRGRMILLYFSSDYEPSRTLDIVLTRSKAQIERLIELNPTESAS